MLSHQASSKKRKLNDGKQKNVKGSANGKGKEKEKEPKRERLADSGKIPIPHLQDDNVELSDQDMEMLEEFGGGASFLNKLDRNGIMRCERYSMSFASLLIRHAGVRKKQ